jgi:enoyl-CoA hydratase/carnithine racemase
VTVAGPAPLLSAGEAIRRLQSPYALEDWATLTGAPALVVDLPADSAHESGSSPPSPREVVRARRVLRQLACPSVALRGAELSPLARELVADFDVVVASRAELAALLDVFQRRPLASLALVQLLRHGEGLDLHAALIAESWAYSTLQAGPEFAAWARERGSPREPKPAIGSAVLVERDGDCLALTLNRPERHNAFSSELRDALVEALQLALGDECVREVVLRGAGASFCSGGDLDEFGSLPDPATAHAVRSTRNASRLLAELSERTRAEIHGACIGAGVELPAFTSRVTAHPQTWLQLPEVGMGLVPGAGGTASLPRRIGRQRTAWLALAGVRLDAATALAWGLVDEIREFPLAADERGQLALGSANPRR